MFLDQYFTFGDASSCSIDRRLERGSVNLGAISIRGNCGRTIAQAHARCSLVADRCPTHRRHVAKRSPVHSGDTDSVTERIRGQLAFLARVGA